MITKLTMRYIDKLAKIIESNGNTYITIRRVVVFLF